MIYWEANKRYELKLESRVITPSAMFEAKKRLQELGRGDVAKIVDSMPEKFKPSMRRSTRISHWANENGLPFLTEGQLTAIGNVISRGQLDEGDYYFDFTQDFNWKPGDFGDSGSCYWGMYEYLRTDMMPYNGFWAMRQYDADGHGIGRCWMAPFGKHWAIFNGYGPGELKLFANILQAWGNKVATHVNLEDENDYGDEGAFYINSEMGYVVADARCGGYAKFRWREPIKVCPITGKGFTRNNKAYFTQSDGVTISVHPSVEYTQGVVRCENGNYAYKDDTISVYYTKYDSRVFHIKEVEMEIKGGYFVRLDDGRVVWYRSCYKGDNGEWIVSR